MENQESVNYRKERRHVVLTVGVLAVWICFVLAVVSRSTSVALTKAGQSLEYAGPLLLVLLVSIGVLVIFCLPSRLGGDDEEEKEKLIPHRNEGKVEMHGVGVLLDSKEEKLVFMGEGYI